MPQRNEKPAPRRIDDEVREALDWLERKSTRRDRENLKRFGINATNAIGVSMANIQTLGKRLGRSHELAEALWDTRCYEARLLASFVDEPERVTAAQMDRWCRDFDNWGVCDTVCFFLFDRTPHAYRKVEQWSGKREEFVKRAAFALLASLAGHDKQASDAAFLKTLPLIERAATDDRNFVMKGVSWALRRIGTRSAALKKASLTLAHQLSESEHPSARWIARETIKDLSRPAKARR